jgi:hypothetical protein
MKSWETLLSLRVAVIVRSPAVMVMGVPELCGFADDLSLASASVLGVELEVVGAGADSSSLVDEHAARVNTAAVGLSGDCGSGFAAAGAGGRRGRGRDGCAGPQVSSWARLLDSSR